MNITYSRTHRIFFVSLSILLIMPLVLPAALKADPARSESASILQEQQTGQEFVVKGSVSIRYLYRAAEFSGSKASDSDLFEHLRFDVIAPKKKYEFHFLATARERLNEARNEPGFFPFEDIGDTYSSKTIGYIYDAHLAINDPLPYLPQVRIGRQAGTRDEPVFFDGIAGDFSFFRNLNMTAYGGVAVHFFELDHTWGSDLLGGAGFDYTPFRSTMVSLDYLNVRDDRISFLGTDQSDQHYSVSVRQRISPYLRVMARYRYLNSDPRDLKTRLIASLPEADVEISASYLKQFRVQEELSNEFSPYVDILGPSYPFQSYDLKVRKMFGRHYAIDVGYFQRSLVQDQQENAFNRNYKRAFAVFEMADLLHDGLVFAVIGDYWDAGGRRFTSGGFDAAYSFKKSAKSPRVGIGSYYSVYKYDYYVQLGERQKVRTYYLNGTAPVTKSLLLNAQYEYEDSIENYQTFKIGMRYDF